MKRNITVITGGNGGIGRSVVRKFMENGDMAIVLDLQEVKDEKILNNPNYMFIKTDVTDVNQIQNAMQIIKVKYGYVDNIVGMAGVNMKSEIGGIETITLDDIDKSVKLNLNSHIYIAKIFLNLLKESKNSLKTITMISSINAISDYGLPAYSAAKSGIYGFMKSIANSMAKSRIRVNTISLGTVPHNNEIIEENIYFQEKIKRIPLNEFVRTKHVAETIYNLIYTLTSVVGQNIVLDMGQSV